MNVKITAAAILLLVPKFAFPAVIGEAAMILPRNIAAPLGFVVGPAVAGPMIPALAVEPLPAALTPATAALPALMPAAAAPSAPAPAAAVADAPLPAMPQSAGSGAGAGDSRRQTFPGGLDGASPRGEPAELEFDGRARHQGLDAAVAADPVVSFDRDPRNHPKPRARGSKNERSWADGVLNWMKRSNDPRGLLDKVAAIGLTFQADGAVLGMTGHATTFQRPRNLVLSTSRFWGKMYDFPSRGDFAVWNDDAVEIHYADGRVETQNRLRETIEANSRKVIKRMVGRAVDGDRLKLEWNWTPQEVLYFVFYAAREYVTAPNPTFFMRHAERVSIRQTPESKDWSYVLTIETNLVHTHSARQEVYLDKQGRIGRIRYNFDLLDGGKGLMPIVHDIGGYATSKDGLQVPTRRRATVRWNRFAKGIRRLAARKADDALDGLFGPFNFVLAPLAAPFAAPVVDGVSADVVKSVKDEFSHFSDFGMKVDVNDDLRLYDDERAIP